MRLFTSEDGRSWTAVPIEVKEIPRPIAFGWQAVLFRTVAPASAERIIYRPVGWKRRHLRVDVELRANVLYNGMLYGLNSETISEGGIYIKKEVPLPVGSEVQVSFNAGNGNDLSLNGRVIYVRVFNNYDIDISPGMAVEFMGMKQDEAAELTRYVVSIINEDLTFN